MLVVTKNVFELGLTCIRSQFTSCQLSVNGASYASKLGWHSQVTKKIVIFRITAGSNYF